MRASLGALCALLIFAPVLAGEHPEHPKATPAPAAEATPATGAAALEGKTFTGELGKAGAAKGDPDTLTFDKGAFLSAACVPFGFSGTPYEVSEGHGATTFTAKATNAKGETMEWKGSLRGDALQATAVHKTASGETETYWFKGKATGAPKAAEAPKSEHPEHPKK